MSILFTLFSRSQYPFRNTADGNAAIGTCFVIAVILGIAENDHTRVLRIVFGEIPRKRQPIMAPVILLVDAVLRRPRLACNPHLVTLRLAYVPRIDTRRVKIVIPHRLVQPQSDRVHPIGRNAKL